MCKNKKYKIQIEDIQDKAFHITKKIEDLCIIHKSLNSKTMKKIIGDNIEISTKIMQVVWVVSEHINKNFPNYDELSKNIVYELQKTLSDQFGVFK